jgi:hypothetical protein
MKKVICKFTVAASCFIALFSEGLYSGEWPIKLSELSIKIQKGVPGVIYGKDEENGRQFGRFGFIFPKPELIDCVDNSTAIEALLGETVEKLVADPMQVIVLSNALLRTERFSEFQKLYSIAASVEGAALFTNPVLMKKAGFARKTTGFRPLYIVENAEKTGLWIFYDTVTTDLTRLSADYFSKVGPVILPAIGNLNKDKDLMDLFNALVYDQMQGTHSVQVTPE